MPAEYSTLSSLRADFGLTEEGMMRLAIRCGIPTATPGRRLTDEERDRIYDAWISSGENDERGRPPVRRTSPAPRSRRKSDRITLIDTCSLLENPGGELFLRNGINLLSGSGEKVIVPLAVVNELERLANQQERQEISERARKILRIVLELKEAGTIGVYGDKNDGTFADNVFQKVITMLGRRYCITVITQERDLAQDILAMGHMASVRRKRISVRKINAHGKLVNVSWKGEVK